MKKIISPLWVLLVVASVQAEESLSSPTTISGGNGDACLIIEADLDNANESDTAYIQMSQDGGLNGAYMGFHTEGNSSDNVFNISTVFNGNISPSRFSIKAANGNVGIGTTNPSSIIHVNAPSDATGDVFIFEGSSASEGLNLALRSTGGAFPLFKLDNSLINSVWNIENGRYGDGALTFYRGGSGTKLIINEIGNVGIGTTSPSNKLDVAGTIRAEEIIVASDWADFVFEDGYELPSLESVEQHIEQKGHLPGVPSSEQVKSQGLSLGESQALMMQKLEELTLYMIDLKNENQELREELADLRSQVGVRDQESD